ncbi:DUF2846 domain-containing protein [Undibacterium sp. Di27W]|uniref:DUF2846 domain-containing protein n=1 Tax=Undibacterium sp. Di27W TaxID=3413036 RepID=UPI003BEF7B29
MMKRYFILLISILLTACAATGPAYQAARAPENGKALIYVYRVKSFALGGRDAYFYVDGKNIADLSVEGYTWFQIPAGEHKFEQRWPADVPGSTNPVTAKIAQLFKKSSDDGSVEKKTLQQGYVNWEAGQTYYYRFGTNLAGTSPMKIEWFLQEITAEQALPELKKTKLQNSFTK